MSRRINAHGTVKNEEVDVFDCLPQPYRMITKLIEVVTCLSVLYCCE
jgi:hypothetical protein